MLTSKLYPQANNLNETAATAALGMVQAQLQNQTWSYCTRGELLEAAAALTMRLDYLWENGGRDEFNALIERTFGRPASHDL